METTNDSLLASAEVLDSFHDDVQYLWCDGGGQIPVLAEPPSPLEFLRSYVSKSRPCIIRGAISTEAGKSFHLSLDDLVSLNPQQELCVDITPDGHGDCLRKVQGHESRIFVKPQEQRMSIAQFARHLRQGRSIHGNDRDSSPTHHLKIEDRIQNRVFDLDENCHIVDEDCKDTENAINFDRCVLYYSRQNDCLREELGELWNKKQVQSPIQTSGKTLFPRSISWAEEAFDVQGPDAVNLWMGDERAVSSMHKDHYENLFYVCSGEKVFTLCPPADAPFLYEREAVGGRFIGRQGPEQKENQWNVHLDRDPDTCELEKVHWIASNVLEPDLQDFPLLRHTHVFPEVRVQEGEMLYLPSLWFHRVTQTRESVAINYWYDMKFETPSWIYFHLLQQMKVLRKTQNNDNKI